jgi:hypothetical protein
METGSAFKNILKIIHTIKPRNRLPSVMKHYSPTGRRNHGRPLKRLLDGWDRNGSTSGPTPWQIYDDDDKTNKLADVKTVIFTHNLSELQIFRSILIILRELLNINKAHLQTDGLLTTRKSVSKMSTDFIKLICSSQNWSIDVEVVLPYILTLSNQILLPTAYSPALICFWRERGW